MTFKSCLRSMRLRTLPLSLAGVIAGISLAADHNSLNWPLVTALLLTTVLLQILSNLSNELGDTLSGTDTEQRQGIHYSLQDGGMSIAQMKAFIAVVAVLCCCSGAVMTWLSFGTLFSWQPMLLLALGAAAIWAAVNYTLGKNPYGYRGKGDYFVFVFFGLVAVIGAAYVCSHSFEWLWLLPGAAFGAWSVAVLNVNNIRDMKTDSATRTTVALKLGVRKARIYQTVLIASGWLFLTVYFCMSGKFSVEAWKSALTFLTLPFFAFHLYGVWTRNDRALDPMLPLLVLSSFATSLLFAL